MLPAAKKMLAPMLVLAVVLLVVRVRAVVEGVLLVRVVHANAARVVQHWVEWTVSVALASAKEASPRGATSAAKRAVTARAVATAGAVTATKAILTSLLANLAALGGLTAVDMAVRAK